MKRVIAIFLLLMISAPVFAEVPKAVYKKNLPQGTFKKKKDGTIVQYNSKGKKIGTYKFSNGEYKKVK